jgi:hypothetical protein
MSTVAEDRLRALLDQVGQETGALQAPPEKRF